MAVCFFKLNQHFPYCILFFELSLHLNWGREEEVLKWGKMYPKCPLVSGLKRFPISIFLRIKNYMTLGKT